jgi:hypothetical protein
MPWTVCLSVYWNDSLQNTHGRTCSWKRLEILFLYFIWNYGSPSLPAKFWGTFSSIVYNELDYIFLLNFGNLRSDLLLTSKIWFLKFGSYAVCDCSCIWVWLKSKRLSKVHVFITNYFVDLVKDLSMTWASFVGLVHMKKKPWAYRWS